MATPHAPFRQRKLEDQAVTISHVSSKLLSQNVAFVSIVAWCNSPSVGQHKYPLAYWLKIRFSSRCILWSISRCSPLRDGDPAPTHCPSLLFCSDVSVLYQLSFPYTCFCAAVLPSVEPVHCRLCANVLQRTVLNFNYACVQPPQTHPHKHTETYTHTYIQWW